MKKWSRHSIWCYSNPLQRWRRHFSLKESFALWWVGVNRQALLLSGSDAGPLVHELLDKATQKLLEAKPSKSESNDNSNVQLPDRDWKRRRTQHKDFQTAFPVKRVHVPSLQEFQQNYMKLNVPVIITGAMETWPAMGRSPLAAQNWKDLEYLRSVAGMRTVPIEVGATYLDDKWSARLMTFNELFLDRHILSDENGIGYLAQHELFEQIPELGRDIQTPEYCSLSREENQQKASSTSNNRVAVNAWFGPKGTVSPLHFDPKDNLLCQVVGRKYLKLFAPEESTKLYPIDGLLCNTSQVQLDHVDPKEFPLVETARFQECELCEGEMLYLPAKYWHYVKSQSVSFSVSFWW